VIRIDDERVREHLGHIVGGTVEETLNAMLEAEADRLCNAGRYERTAARRDQRAGSYDRKLQTKAGAVTLKVPKLRQQTFETAIIERDCATRRIRAAPTVRRRLVIRWSQTEVANLTPAQIRSDANKTRQWPSPRGSLED